jgi:hypothetical protein
MRLAYVTLLCSLILTACSSRGTSAPGWVVYDDHVSYHGIAQSHDACDLTVAYARTASFLDDDQAHTQEALDAFREVALSLSKSNYDPHDIQMRREVTANGVLRITMTCVIKP